MSTPEPTDEELRAAMEEQLQSLRVEDVLLQTTVTLVNLAARRLGLAAGPEEKDIEQARLAIEGARGLVPLMPPEPSAQIREALSQLQMAYAQEVQAGGGGSGAPPAPGPPPAPGEPPAPGDPAAAPPGAPPPPGTAASEATGGGGTAPPPSPPPAPGESPEAARRRAEEEVERALARSKIWTPRGA